ncbi:MAG: tetratricopeptide repeat protein [Bryobacterales bacterium]|nr:tetratricopeptide repeat protein [Bryobacterales bacterium]
MKRIIVCAVAIAFAAAGGAPAQESGGGTTGGGNTNTGGGGNTNTNTNTGGGNQGGRGGQQGNQSNDPFGQQQQRMPEIPRPIFLSGKVVMDNGQPPPEPVTIVRNCSGQRFPEAYSDPKGNFSFQVGANPSVALTDASVSGFGNGTGSGGFGSSPFGGGIGGGQMSGDMSVDFTGCDLTAELPGFRSERISLGRRRAMDNPDIGIIVIHSLGGPVSSIISATTLQAPKKAKSSYDKAMREMTKKTSSPEKAAKELEKAVEEYPQFAAAWALLGDTRAKMENHEGAKEAYEKAVAADPDYLRPYPALVQMAVNANDWERTSELSQKMLSINPGITQVRFYQAVAQLNLGRIDDARTTTMHIQTGPDAAQFPKTHQIMGLIYSQQGAFSEAAKEYRAYLKAEPDTSNAEKVKKQLNEWEALGVIQPE